MQFDLLLRVFHKCSPSVANSPHPFALSSSESQRKIDRPQMLAFQGRDRHSSKLFCIPPFASFSVVYVVLK